MRSFPYVICVALIALCASCGRQAAGPDNQGSTQNAADAGLTVINVGNGAEPDTLDPQKAQGNWEANIIGEMFLGLTTDGADGSPVPGAAVSWQTSPDGLTWTFKLRDGLKWSDGVPVTADDFVYSLRRILDPKTAAQYASVLYVIKNAEAVNGGKLPTSALGVSAIDAKTLRIELAHPAPYLLQLAKHQTMFAIPQHIVEKYGSDWIKPEHIVVDGPYKLKEWIPNDHIKLVKNPAFYDAQNVAIDVAYFYPMSDPSVELSRYQAGQLDITSSIPVRQLPWAKQHFGAQVHMHVYLSTGYSYINVNKPPFTDIRVRRALALAVDRETICYKMLKAGEVPAYSLVPPGISNYQSAHLDFEAMPMADRLTEARKLLAEAGFNADHPLRFTYRYFDSPDSQKIAIALQSMWKEIGVYVELLSSESKVQYDALRMQNYDVASAGWIADYDDAEDFLFLFTTANKAMNYSQYSSAKFDALMAEADASPDEAERAKLLAQAEGVLLEDFPIIVEDFGAYRHLVKPYVKGWVDNSTDWHRLRYLSIDRAVATN